MYCQSGGTGRRAGLKIQYSQGCAGSIPAFGTLKMSLSSIFLLLLRTHDKQCLSCILKYYFSGEAQLTLLIAEVVELVDTHVSGACVRKDMGVRVPPSALDK